MEMQTEYITAQEAADLLHITRRAVFAAIDRGAIEAKKFGNAWQVSRESAEAYKERQETK